MTLQTDGDYYLRREQEERAASEAACSLEAKEAHAKLADLYADVGRGQSALSNAAEESLEKLPHLVILSKR